MSWKGFVKAVQRLPHQVKRSTGHADGTVDEEFDDLNAHFEQLADATSKLHDDASKFKKSVEAMLSHQVAFASTLLELYSPISGRSGASSPPPDSSDSATSVSGPSPISPSSSSPTSLKRHFTPTESMEAVQAYLRSVEQIRDPILHELSSIERRIISPVLDLLDVFRAIKKTITKRNHKLIDYDRYSVDVSKLRSTPNKDAKDERRLITIEQQLQLATREYTVLNDALKQQLPTLFQLRTAFIDPCFLSLYLTQHKVYSQMVSALDPVRQVTTLDFNSPVVERFKVRFQQAENLVNQLNILKVTPAALTAAASGTGTLRPASQSPSSVNSGGRVNIMSSSASSMGGGTAMAGSGIVSPPEYSTLPVTSYAIPPPHTVSNALPVPGGSASVPIKLVTALYDFVGQQVDDLSFTAGDRIEVLEATSSTNDWWKGRIGTRVGFFPANYTQ